MSYSPTPANLALKTAAIVTEVQEYVMIVFLYDIKQAAYLPLDSKRVMPKLGQTFECEYVTTEEYLNIYHRVTRVLKIVEGTQEMKIDGSRIQIAVHVDMHSRNRKWNEWCNFGGQPIVNSDDVEAVLLDRRVEGPDGTIVEGKILFDHYKGQERSKKMVGWCRYVCQTVPRSLCDDEYDGEERIQVYVWQMTKLEGLASVYDCQQADFIRDNLGKEAKQLEREDDIARQKRINHEQEELARNGESLVIEYRHHTVRPPTVAGSVDSYHTALHTQANTPLPEQRTAGSVSSFHTANDAYGGMKLPPGLQGQNHNSSSQSSQYSASLPPASSSSIVSDSRSLRSTMVTPTQEMQLDTVVQKDKLLKECASAMNKMRNTIKSVLQDEGVLTAIRNVGLQDLLDITDHLEKMKELTKEINDNVYSVTGK